MKTILHPDAGIEVHFSSPEKKNLLVSDLKNNAAIMTEKVLSHPEIESAWLSSMAYMESSAAYGIKKSINHSTPDHEIESILDHYNDEMRHAKQLHELKKVSVESINGVELQSQLCKVAKKFTFGFFMHPLVQEVSKKAQFAGYVHAALTIEQIPFQMYSHYFIKSTGDTKRALVDILKDEHVHLKLGKRLYQQLENDFQSPIDLIQTLEIEMCLQLVNEINLQIDHYIKAA